jgi:hypothetical protein
VKPHYARMAPDPNLSLRTIAYKGGTVTAVAGLLDYLFDNVTGEVSWTAPASPADPVTGRRRRKYGTRQRSSSRAGEAMQLVLKNGKTYIVRVTGAHIDFVEFFLSQGGGSKVANVYSERGTEYGPQAKAILNNG